MVLLIGCISMFMIELFKFDRLWEHFRFGGALTCCRVTRVETPDTPQTSKGMKNSLNMQKDTNDKDSMDRSMCFFLI